MAVADLPTLEFLSSLADTLAAGTVDLPAFPQVVIKVQEAFKDPNYTPQKVARVISTERSLADRLLQMANSTAQRDRQGDHRPGCCHQSKRRIVGRFG